MPPRTLRQLSEVAPVDVVVRLEEDLAQPRLPERIVLQVELVEPVERVLVRVHVEGIDRELVRGQVQRLEHLFERQFLSVTEDDHVL